MTALYSILHFLVDGVCAFAMFGYFVTQDNWYLNMLLYNFCAFAMQMPLGVVLDGLNGQEKQPKYQLSFGFAVVGVMLTLVGAVTHPIVLGLGNALFHLGGGVGTICEDEAKGWRGRGLGVFVAPGALGLYIGTQAAKGGMEPGWTWIIFIGMTMLLCLECGRQILQRERRMQNVVESGPADEQAQEVGPAETASAKSIGVVNKVKSEVLWGMLGCLAVVIMRSYIGMAVSFSWKTAIFAGTLAVLAVVLGKVAGGFAAASMGTCRTVIISLGLAAVCYLFSENMIAGIFALFFFNMTMPITLYLLVQRIKGMPGFAFGLLTFGLFLGFLPVYFGVALPWSGGSIGCAGSLVSLVILWMCVRENGKKTDLQVQRGEPVGHIAESEKQEAG